MEWAEDFTSTRMILHNHSVGINIIFLTIHKEITTYQLEAFGNPQSNVHLLTNGLVVYDWYI